MKSYYGIFKMEFKGELQYRAKAISGITTQIFWGFLLIYLYTAFMNSNSSNDFTLLQMTSYIWLGQAFFAMRYVTLSKRVADEITNGNVCYKFVKPISIYEQWYFEGLGQKIAATLLRFLPIVIIGVLLPNNLKLMLPVNFEAFILFIFSLVLGFLMTEMISMFGVYLTFKTMSGKGAIGFISAISGLFSGLVVPLPMLPQGVQNVIKYLPFSFISDLPFRIYIGNVNIIDGLKFLLIGILWLIALYAISKLLINKSLKKTVIQGG